MSVFLSHFKSYIQFVQGVMMTHGNVLATVSAVMTIVPGLGSKDVYLAYLPLAHILELAAEVCIFFLDYIKKISGNLILNSNYILSFFWLRYLNLFTFSVFKPSYLSFFNCRI